MDLSEEVQPTDSSVSDFQRSEGVYVVLKQFVISCVWKTQESNRVPKEMSGLNITQYSRGNPGANADG